MRSIQTVVLLTALAAPAGAEVHYYSAAQVAAAFAKGSVLYAEPGINYMVHASRREAAGQVEIHVRDADVIYVLDGRATFVTGGQAIDAHEVEPGEIRGREIQGGDSRTLTKGDVVIVPAGTPHWFQHVDPPFLYYVVKVR